MIDIPRMVDSEVNDGLERYLNGSGSVKVRLYTL